MNEQDTTTTLIRLPKSLLDAVSAQAGKRGMSKFFREAAAEKLARDFGVVFASDVVNLKQGKRTDLANADEKTLAKMRSQAEHMRKSRWKPKE